MSKNSRRYFLKLAGSGAMGITAISLTACSEYPNYRDQIKKNGAGNVAADAADNNLEASKEFTRDDPGPWAGKEDGHLPTLSLTADNMIKITVNHPMEADHYISRLRIEDEFQTVLVDKTMTARTADESVVDVKPPLPGEARRIRVISDCNLHGRWVEVYEIESYLAGFAQDEIYSGVKPGPWSEKIAGHMPAISLDENESIVITTDHGMSPEHLISAHEIRTESGAIIYKGILSADDEANTIVQAMLPAQGDFLHVRSECNLHGTWELVVPIDGYLAGLNDLNIYTELAPGRFAGKEAGHLPSFAVANGLATINTEHEMVPGHYISKQQVINEVGEVIYEKAYTPNDLAATVSVPVAEVQARIAANAATTFSVRSFCNKHKNWQTTYNIADIDFTA